MKKKFTIIFMGTPEFAVPALKSLKSSGHEPALVVTQPDRPMGRGRRVVPPPVKEAAIGLGLEVIQPASIRTAEFSDHLRQIGPDFLAVVAFGHILPKALLDLPRVGPVNVHASILPKYRGPAPIQWAILNRERRTGVTTMFMDKGLDTGDILLSETIEIAADDTSTTLHDRLAGLGADLLVRTLDAFEAGAINRIPQDHSQATYAPLLKKDDGHIDWRKPAEALEAFVRGMTPWPGAFTFFKGKRLKVFKAEPLLRDAEEPPGTVVKGFPGELRIATGKGILSVLEVQGASGKRLPIKDFLRGCTMSPGTILG